MCDWDKVFGNPKSCFIINVIILNTKKAINMNRQMGRAMPASLAKYRVYQQLKADEHKANLYMTMPHFDERWNIVYDSLRHFEMDIKIFTFSFTATRCQHSYCLFIVFNLKHCLKIMLLLPVVEIQ